jgi:hypothetical protein
LIGAAAIVCTTGIALATPIVGLVSPLLAVGTHDGDLHAHGSAALPSGERFHLRFSTAGAATVSTQDFAFAGVIRSRVRTGVIVMMLLAFAARAV